MGLLIEISLQSYVLVSYDKLEFELHEVHDEETFLLQEVLVVVFGQVVQLLKSFITLLFDRATP